MLEHRRTREPKPVSRWASEPAIGQICARDALGEVVMAIQAGPGFAARLAAAFHTMQAKPQGYSATGLRPPAFPP